LFWPCNKTYPIIDFGDLVRHNLNDGSEGHADKKIRIATVDNFQGEESDVVIISLVRSDPVGGRIGFLSSEQRINVLFSRAREGMYIVGNLESLTECASKPGRELWSNLKSVFDDDNNVYDYFPANCQKHTTLHKIRTPEDFVRLAPEGGCALKCTLLLECGHQCPKKCHGHVEHVHSLIKCKEKVEDVCTYGHKQLRECYSTVKCTKTMKWLCPRGHSLRGICQKGRPKACTACDKLEELEDEAERRVEEQEKKLLERKEHLAATKSKLAGIMESQESASKFKMIELEQKLLDKEVSRALAPTPVDSDSDSLDSVIDMDIGNIQKENSKESRKTDDGDVQAKDVVSALAFEVEGSVVCKDDSGGGGGGEYNGDNEGDDFDDNSSGASVVHSASEAANEFSGNRENKDKNKIKKSDDTARYIPLQIPLKSNSLFRNADFCDAIQKFQAELFLEADDVIENCFNTKQNKTNTDTLHAFRYIIHNSLDPSEKKWEEAHSYANRMKKPKSFSEAVQCWASFVSFASTNEFPLITKEVAELFLSYKGISDNIAEGLLEIGRGRARNAIDEAQNKIRSLSSAKPSKDIQVEAAIKKDWTNISKQDSNAPAVVNEVLSMTGLNEIKEALIDQYNRIRISQRQGDAAASSYNVRFEGNPGTGK
jgi:hypothetical protein